MRFAAIIVFGVLACGCERVEVTDQVSVTNLGPQGGTAWSPDEKLRLELEPYALESSEEIRISIAGRSSDNDAGSSVYVIEPVHLELPHGGGMLYMRKVDPWMVFIRETDALPERVVPIETAPLEIGARIFRLGRWYVRREPCRPLCPPARPPDAGLSDLASYDGGAQVVVIFPDGGSPD